MASSVSLRNALRTLDLAVDGEVAPLVFVDEPFAELGFDAARRACLVEVPFLASSLCIQRATSSAVAK